MRYVLKCRYNRFEGGRLRRYHPGEEIELNAAEQVKLRMSIELPKAKLTSASAVAPTPAPTPTPVPAAASSAGPGKSDKQSGKS